MITYECSVVCDKCAQVILSGEPKGDVAEAKKSATTIAKRNGWHFKFDGRMICPLCQPKKFRKGS